MKRKTAVLSRGKCWYSQEWVFGTYMDCGCGNNMGFILQNADLDDSSQLEIANWYEVLEDTVGHSSGERDHDGTIIFEGDVLLGMFLFGMQIKSVCKFKNGSFGAAFYRNGHEEFTPFTSYSNTEWTVIGNIYDSPALLEEIKNG